MKYGCLGQHSIAQIHPQNRTYDMLSNSANNSTFCEYLPHNTEILDGICESKLIKDIYIYMFFIERRWRHVVETERRYPAVLVTISDIAMYSQKRHRYKTDIDIAMWSDSDFRSDSILYDTI